MRTLILAFCVALSLSACETSGAGEGPPPTFSPSVQAHFEQYLEEANPTVFVVSTDGRYAHYRYCPAISCLGTVESARKARKACEKRSGGVPCKVYAFGRKIKWTGPSGGHSGQAGGSISASDSVICNFAITTKDGTVSWESRGDWLGYANEAKRRDLTPEQCAELLGR